MSTEARRKRLGIPLDATGEEAVRIIHQRQLASGVPQAEIDRWSEYCRRLNEKTLSPNFKLA